jgi:hypothetical protein
MPDISILEPRVINGVIEKFLIPQNLMGLSMVPQRSHPFPVWQYDIVSGTRGVASTTTPGSMGKIVVKSTIGTIAGGFIYSREKKIFDPVTLHWLREPGQVAANNAEREVLRELQELSARFDRLKEFFIWKMFSGSLSYTRDNTIVSIDYLMSATHKPTAATYWTNPNSDPMDDIRAWKQLVTHDGHAVVTDAYLNVKTMQALQNHAKVRQMMSDRQRDTYYSEGFLPRFQTLDWHEYDLGFVDDFTDVNNPAFTTYIPDGYIVFMAKERDPWVMLQGPSADDEAPNGYTGRFTKTWKEKDPSARQVLMEESSMPILLRPEQLVYAKVF